MALTATMGLCCGACGTTRENRATEQLLLSDAVDRAVARVDFSPLQGEKVFLDSQYMPTLKANAVVHTEYITSALRQQMVLAGCLLQDARDKADYIVEPRVGALGSDGHDVNYGVPPNQTLNAAASIVPGAGAIPAIPEISLGRRTDDTAAAKIAVFAYHRETKQPVWQSGLKIARSSARGRWILGAGPFESGSIYRGTQFAGNRLSIKDRLTRKGRNELSEEEEAYGFYRSAAVWDETLRAKLRGDASVEKVAARPDDARADAPESAPPSAAGAPAEAEGDAKAGQ
jgi:hypothetical protein